MSPIASGAAKYVGWNPIKRLQQFQITRLIRLEHQLLSKHPVIPKMQNQPVTGFTPTLVDNAEFGVIGGPTPTNQENHPNDHE